LAAIGLKQELGRAGIKERKNGNAEGIESRCHSLFSLNAAPRDFRCERNARNAMVMNRNRLENAFGASEGTPDIDDGLLLTQYLRARDQAAFEMLVHRHGSMILGTCQRILRNQV
jgi:hypothetical protein